MKSERLKSVFLHLRLPFSLLLLPVYLFALSAAPNVNNTHALLVFVILHFFIYPASNGYNSYFDKDEDSIALIKNPPKVNYSLYITSICLEWIGASLALLVSIQFCIGVIIFNSLSKAYSHSSVRLKKYPIISFLVVFIFQGGFIFLLCYGAISNSFFGFKADEYLAASICSCLIGASYPITQIYQHQEDGKRGDKTLSILLGYKGSFIFSGIVFFIGLSLMFLYWQLQNDLINFYVFAIMGIPILTYFIWWFYKVIKDIKHANFRNTMRMTMISGLTMLIYFTWLVFVS
ncbi:ubiquinone biosynthesis protein UbiA [Pedobacter psychrophilus]|uniref:Ubiquinone biosynthesis protein UbiA n=1 Tax=Pedobacter psychrophilus TaxID=1826909 RepID=A0A179DD55_9SPHI|nr:UbiA family prenyltransferase [Pedobacter psychrophilus]OAQ38459.1 ubiquinone biosynthesis protein UbiA [Pedobacter psychrophilus]